MRNNMEIKSINDTPVGKSIHVKLEFDYMFNQGIKWGSDWIPD